MRLRVGPVAFPDEEAPPVDDVLLGRPLATAVEPWFVGTGRAVAVPVLDGDDDPPRERAEPPELDEPDDPPLLPPDDPPLEPELDDPPRGTA